MAETYGITEIARLLGISKEAIRKYEAKGLLHSARDEGNGYRKYDSWDVTTLIQIRLLRGMGFSLGNIEELINTGDLPQLEAALHRKKETVAAELLRLQELFLMLDQHEKELQAVRDTRREFWLEYRPALCLLPIGEWQKLTKNRDLRDESAAWLEKAPYTFHCGLYSPDVTFQGHALALEEKYMDMERRGDMIRYAPSRLCACVMLEFPYGKVVEEDLRRKLERIRACGYKTGGEIMTRIVFTHKRGEQYFCYNKIWFPIEKEKT